MQRFHSCRVLMLWYTIGDNFGDVLIYQTVRDCLKSIGLDVEIHEVGDKCDTIFRHANQCDFLLFAGGGIIERYIPDVIQRCEENYQILEVPYGIMGFGMGTFDYEDYRKQISFWVRHAKFVYVRDMYTQDTLNWIAGCEKAVFTSDCVFYNDLKIKCNDSEQRVGVNIRDLPYPDITGEIDWISLNSALEKCGCDLLIPDSSQEYLKMNLNLENVDTMEMFKEKERDMKIAITVHSISRCRYVIAMRYHVVLVAARMGVLPISIIYCPKVRFLVQQLGIEELSIEVGEYGILPRRFHEAVNNYEKYRNIVNQNVLFMEKKSKQMFDEVKNFFHTYARESK